MEGIVFYRLSWKHKLTGPLKMHNFDLQTAGVQRKVSANELSDTACSSTMRNSLIYKEKTEKRIHDAKIKNRVFNVGDQVLLFNSRLKIFSGKLKSRWSGPFTIVQVFPYGTVELSQNSGPNFNYFVLTENLRVFDNLYVRGVRDTSLVGCQSLGHLTARLGCAETESRNGYLRKGRKTKPKRQNQTSEWKEGKEQVKTNAQAWKKGNSEVKSQVNSKAKSMDKSQITRKQSKASKHGHENQKSTKPKPEKPKP
ncbi:hypothetical protein Tco_0662177 [Tanacetum coccineum]